MLVFQIQNQEDMSDWTITDLVGNYGDQSQSLSDTGSHGNNLAALFGDNREYTNMIKHLKK